MLFVNIDAEGNASPIDEKIRKNLIKSIQK
jgi:hypothetical protein